MLGIDSSELLLVALVALVVIGPKDLPKAMRVVGYWVGRARGVARQFRSGFDEMVREAELAEMEKRWAAENARIMAEHPQTDPGQADTARTDPASAASSPGDTSGTAVPPKAVEHDRPSVATHDDAADDATRQPVMVEKPHVGPATDRPVHREDGVSS